MATALAKLFKKKHNKENNEPFLKHRDGAEKVERSSSANSIGVYVGDNSSQMLPRGSFGGSSMIPNASDSKWKYKSPYSVISEPKTRKPTRSCPGAPINSRSSGYGRNLSPDYGTSRAHHNSRHPTIFEVSGSYENYPNDDGDNTCNGTLPLDERTLYAKSALRKPTRVLTAQNSDSTSGSVRERSTFQRHQNKRQSLNLRNVYTGQRATTNNYHRSRQHNNVTSTSEYGSGDPSPNASDSIAIVGSSSRATNDFFRYESFDNTDYDDSDSDDGVPISIVDICEQQLRKAASDCHKYKEKAHIYKQKYLRTRGELEKVQHENKSLKSDLEKAKVEREHFRSFINQQFRNVNSHYRNKQQEQLQKHPQQQIYQEQQRWMQQRLQQQQQFGMEQNFIEPMNQQQQNLRQFRQQGGDNIFGVNSQDGQQQAAAAHSLLNEWQETDSVENQHVLGAGEALCSETELRGAINPAFSADIPTPSIRSENSHNILKENSEDVMDDIRVFRNLELEDNTSIMSYGTIEQARTSSTNVTPSIISKPNLTCQFSPPLYKHKDGDTTKLIADEEEETRSVMQKCAQEDMTTNNGADTAKTDLAKKNQTIAPIRQASKRRRSSSYNCDEDPSSDDSLNLEKYVDEPVKSIDFLASSPRRQGNSLLTRRSFSDTDLTDLNLCANNENNYSFVINFDEAITHCDKKSQEGYLIERRKHVDFYENNGELKAGSRRMPKDRYCRYSPKRDNDASSNYSSDDDAIRIFARQLRKRGNVVHFRPPRKNLVNIKHTLFRFFGSGERDAIAQFDYLKDMPTDVSGFASSPSSQ